MSVSYLLYSGTPELGEVSGAIFFKLDWPLGGCGPGKFPAGTLVWMISHLHME